MEKKANNGGGKPIPLFKSTPERIQSLSQDELRRRKKKILQRKRKIKRLFMSLVLIIILCAVGAALSLTVFFKIETVTVTGGSLYSEESVAEASGIKLGDNLLRADKKSIEERLKTSLPYIGSAEIEKKLPSTVVITVEETREVAAISYEGGYVLLSPEGKVLDGNAVALRENVALVEGVSLSEVKEGAAVNCTAPEKLGALEAVLKGLDESGIDGISSIDLTDVNNITLKYDFRIKLVIGSASNATEKLKRAVRVIEKENAINSTQYGTLDLRSEPNSYFRPGEETERATVINTENSSENTAETTSQAPREG